MNEEIVRALLRVKHAIKDNVLTNGDLVDTFLKDMFPDDKYVGDRMLLLTLMREGLPLKAREGRFDDETALNAEARRIAQTYHMDEDWVRKALLTWRYVAQADESATASGRVDADFLQLLSGSVPELKEAETSPVPAPQTSGGRKGLGLVLLAVLLLAGLAAWHLKGAMPDNSFIELCQKGTMDEVRRALASGANVHAKDKDGVTALMWGAANPNPEVVKALLERGADINAKIEDGQTALMWAAANPNPEVVKVLLAGGANVNAETIGGWTALMHAACNPNPEVVKALLERGADIRVRNNNGMTALMEAAMWNHNPEVVKVLLENGADVSAVDKNGHDAIWWARIGVGDQEKVIQILKRY